jgi:hypothetical protein
MSTPQLLTDIANDVSNGRQRRVKVRTLMARYGLKRRRSQGLAVIRADMRSLGIATIPDFESAGFDEQVRFVIAGAEDEQGSDAADSQTNASYRIEAEPGGDKPRYRVLLRTYDAYERFHSDLVSGRRAQIFQSGQNPRREDRDAFPFHAVLQLGERYAEEDLDAWLWSAACLDDDESDSAEPPTPHVAEGLSTDWHSDYLQLDDFRERILDLRLGLRADMESQITELRAAMDQKVDEIRFDAIQKLAKQINDDEAMKVISEFDSEMRGKLAAKDQELTDKQKEINLLLSKVAEAELDQLERDNYDPADAYPTLVATVVLFADICIGSPIEVHDRALKTAQRSASIRRREVLQFLLTLKDFAEALYLREGIGKSAKGWFSDRGYDYAKADSETTATKYGDEREIQIGETRAQLAEHVTLFPNTRDCVSIYFARDADAKKLIVGYVGPHLRTVGR